MITNFHIYFFLFPYHTNQYVNNLGYNYSIMFNVRKNKFLCINVQMYMRKDTAQKDRPNTDMKVMTLINSIIIQYQGIVFDPNICVYIRYIVKRCIRLTFFFSYTRSLSYQGTLRQDWEISDSMELRPS
jgi:hypothetical protein